MKEVLINKIWVPMYLFYVQEACNGEFPDIKTAKDERRVLKAVRRFYTSFAIEFVGNFIVCALVFALMIFGMFLIPPGM